MENKIKSLIKKLRRLGFSVKPKKESHTDPVCGMKTSDELFKVDYRSKNYYFCSAHCKDEFAVDPGSYVN